MELGANSEFLNDLIEEEADAAALLSERAEELERPQDAQWPPWSGYIRTAWDALRDDRFMGDMGGMGGIYSTAIDGYAQRHGIEGEDFDNFVTFIRALDTEFLRHISEKRKAQAEADKRRNS